MTDKDLDVGIPQGTGVKVSGVVGLGPLSPRPANQKVVFTGSTAWAQVETSVLGDGRFELPSIPAGTYTLRTVPGSFTGLSTLVVANRDITGVVVPGFVELSGVVVLQDGEKFPPMSTAVMIQAIPPKGTNLATVIRPDGAFRFPLVEGEYRISLARLPEGLSVKSIVYGAEDLLGAPLKLDGREEPREIRVMVERK